MILKESGKGRSSPPPDDSDQNAMSALKFWNGALLCLPLLVVPLLATATLELAPTHHSNHTSRQTHTPFRLAKSLVKSGHVHPLCTIRQWKWQAILKRERRQAKTYEGTVHSTTPSGLYTLQWIREPHRRVFQHRITPLLPRSPRPVLSKTVGARRRGSATNFATEELW